MVVRQALRTSMVGVALGLVAAPGPLAPWSRSFSRSTGWIRQTYAGVAGVILIVALLATWLPARSAASVDPIAALRTD